MFMVSEPAGQDLFAVPPTLWAALPELEAAFRSAPHLQSWAGPKRESPHNAPFLGDFCDATKSQLHMWIGSCAERSSVRRRLIQNSFFDCCNSMESWSRLYSMYQSIFVTVFIKIKIC